MFIVILWNATQILNSSYALTSRWLDFFVVDPVAFTDKLQEWLLSDKKKVYFPMSLWVQLWKKKNFKVFQDHLPNIRKKKYKMWLEIWISRKQINLEKNCFLWVWNYMSNHPQFFKIHVYSYKDIHWLGSILPYFLETQA